MLELFLFSLKDFIKTIDINLIFYICLSAIFILTIICLFITVFKLRYSVKNRLWLIFSCLGIMAIELWAELIKDTNTLYFLIMIGVVAILSSIIMFIPERGKIASAEQKSLAKFLDSCANNTISKKGETYICEDNLNKSNVLYSPIVTIKAEEKIENNNAEEIDFSHVKNILSRLEYYPLKEQDKKTTRELENAINFAEENGLNVQLKENINDGLGALLKIMSKYAI